jgi:thiamine monophosphate synthase
MVEQKQAKTVMFRLSKSKKGLLCFVEDEMFFTSARQVQKLLDGKVDSVKLRKGDKDGKKARESNQN